MMDIGFSHKKKFKQLILLLCFIPSLCFSQQSYTFLTTPAAARLSALGGVNVSLAGADINLFTSNPTLSDDSLTGIASVSYQFYLADIGQANVSYQHRFKKIGSLTFNVQHVSYGTIESYDASGATLGEFSAGETALVIGKFFQSNAFRFGTNAKFINSSLAGFNSSAIALDIGGLFIHPHKKMTFGLVIKNIGFPLSTYSSSSSSPLPVDVQLGTTFKPEHMPFRFSFTMFNLFEVGKSNEQNVNSSNLSKILRHLNIGSELLLSKNTSVLFGYNFQKRQDLRLEQISGAAGFTIGLSLHIKNIEMVVSRSSYGPLQASYGFTVSTQVNKLIRKREII
jgi:hypothetical protein